MTEQRRLPHPPLLVITDCKQAVRSLETIVSEAVAAGCRWVSVREKELTETEQIDIARRLTPILHAAGGRLSVHGPPSLALACEADGVHLAAGSDVAAARMAMGPSKLIGLSVHVMAEVQGINHETDYVIIGPYALTASKPGYGPALGLAGVGAFVRASRVPVIAIGGIGPSEAEAAMQAGAAGVAVMGGVMVAKDSAVVASLADVVTRLRRQPRPR